MSAVLLFLVVTVGICTAVLLVALIVFAVLEIIRPSSLGSPR